MVPVGFRNRVLVAFLLTSFSLSGLVLHAQEAKPDSGDQAAAPSKDQKAQEADPLKRPLSDKQRKTNQKALKEELGKTYKKWLNEDVSYIITDEERAAFKQLSNDEERDNFIEAFWARRDPTPRSEEHTSELQSRVDLVCRLLLEKKKTQENEQTNYDVNSL